MTALGNLGCFYCVYPGWNCCFATVRCSCQSVLSAFCHDKWFQRRNDGYCLLPAVFDLRSDVRFSDGFRHDDSLGAMVARWSGLVVYDVYSRFEHASRTKATATEIR